MRRHDRAGLITGATSGVRRVRYSSSAARGDVAATAPWVLYAPPDRPQHGQTPAEVLATAYFARSAELVERTADIIGQDDAAPRYRSLATEVREAFRTAFKADADNLTVPSMTAQALLADT